MTLHSLADCISPRGVITALVVIAVVVLIVGEVRERRAAHQAREALKRRIVNRSGE